MIEKLVVDNYIPLKKEDVEVLNNVRLNNLITGNYSGRSAEYDCDSGDSGDDCDSCYSCDCDCDGMDD